MRVALVNVRGSGRRIEKIPAPALPRRDQALRKSRSAAIALELRFQPQIQPASGRIIGVEGAGSWTGADRPKSCLPRAEAAGLAERLSPPIQRRRCALPAGGVAACSLRLSINLLPRDLERPGYDQWLLGEIKAAGLQPDPHYGGDRQKAARGR
jgi:EAL domain-containing protein (putative c-di-GMP-specific phosphodiesterase class I)